MKKVASILAICIATLTSHSSLDRSELRAEILNNNTPFIRIRIGSNGVGNVDTVVYNAGVPDEFTGVPGVTSAPVTTSSTILGGFAAYPVRIVTDTNFKGNYLNNIATSLTGTFSYDSSTPMQCTTPASCGTETIDFSKISWTARDSDTLVSDLSYDNSPNQQFQVITDSNIANNRTATRHRNYYQFEFDNDTLLPYGTYEGEVTLSGVGAY